MAIRGDKTDYLQPELECLEAIEDFKITTSVPAWVDKYSELYRSITIAPSGLPEIIDSHFGGETFEGISQFGHLYHTVRSIL
jgi:hypothetical protein